MAFPDTKAQLVKDAAQVLHNLQGTAGEAGARVHQVILNINPDGQESLVQYTWDVQAERYDIATLSDG